MGRKRELNTAPLYSPMPRQWFRPDFAHLEPDITAPPVQDGSLSAGLWERWIPGKGEHHANIVVDESRNALARLTT